MTRTLLLTAFAAMALTAVPARADDYDTQQEIEKQQFDTKMELERQRDDIERQKWELRRLETEERWKGYRAMIRSLLPTAALLGAVVAGAVGCAAPYRAQPAPQALARIKPAPAPPPLAPALAGPPCRFADEACFRDYPDWFRAEQATEIRQRKPPPELVVRAPLAPPPPAALAPAPVPAPAPAPKPRAAGEWDI